ncbi:hypothetical protein BDM02DRAFT_3124249 [Thelephora ganbajun]|uniref:Uncharacterized protein n=1 Tax=Thelephora ganbajun TaxID=370292 RepID=A0ACB6YZ02_THEGA|nr:hypothetical protein BDM02DRAFT_3124249 [Thelephora ganbajun]
MILLMNATEESVVLLYVSSFSPSTSGPYSPLVSTGSGIELSALVHPSHHLRLQEGLEKT